MKKEDYPYRQKMIDALHDIQELCDNKASAILDEGNKEKGLDSIDAFVWSSQIMTIHAMCQVLITKALSKPSKSDLSSSDTSAGGR